MPRRKTVLAAALSLLPLGQPLLLVSSTSLATGAVLLSTQAANAQSAELFLKRGYAKFEKGDYQDAIVDYNKAIVINPQLAIAYAMRGFSKVALGDNKGTINDFNRALEIEPKMFLAYYGRGILKVKFGDYQGAIVDYSKAIELNPQNAGSYSSRGVAKRRSGDNQGACSDWRRASALGSTNATKWVRRRCQLRENQTVTVGILHSLSGTMAISESTLVDTEIMAIDEINAAGGIEVDGKKYKIDYIVEDGASDWPTFAEKSKKLLNQDGVPVVFGGWTSASRKVMLPVFESADSLLFYPIQYEGQECSNNIFYTGAVPNQQSEPATKFMFEKSPARGKPFFLVGSDYIFPRTSNAITKEQVKTLGGEVVGEDYLPLGNTEVSPIIAKIKKSLPEGGVIINTLNGDQNVAFFKQIQYAGLTPENGYYVMSYSIAEEDISAIASVIGPEFLEGHYGTWNYMMSIDTSASKKFVSDFKAKYGNHRIVSDPQESAYNMIYLWKAAVEKANSFDDDKVREALIGIEFNAPQGPVKVMPNHHLSQTVRIGKITKDGQFEIVEETDGPLSPQAWNHFEPSSKGYACDWTDPNKGEMYKL